MPYVNDLNNHDAISFCFIVKLHQVQNLTVYTMQHFGMMFFHHDLPPDELTDDFQRDLNKISY